MVNVTPRPPCPQEWPGTHCIGGRIGPRAGMESAKNLASTGIRSPDPPASRNNDYAIPARDI